jgi:serine/threonine protein kinase
VAYEEAIGGNSLPSHYLKLSPALRDYAAKVDSSITAWDEDIFQDVTENGTMLVIEKLPPSERGARVGLCGDKYYCEAAPDNGRNDCLFVYKVESANRRQPRSIPRRYPALVSRLESRSAPGRDSTNALWTDGNEVRIPQISAVAASPIQSPSPQLLKMAPTTPADTRGLWLPGNGLSAQIETDKWLEILRRVWAKFQVSRFVTTSTRQESILKGLVPAQQLEALECSQLLDLFDLGFFNSSARLSADREASYLQLLRWMSSVPLPDRVRARIWAAMATGLEQSELLRELRGIVRILEAPGVPQEARKAWEEALVELMERRLRVSDDEVLRELLDQCREDAQPLATLSRWLFETLTLASEPPQLQDSEPHLPDHVHEVPEGQISTEGQGNQIEGETADDPDSALLREWVLSLQGSDSRQLADVLESISSAVTEITALAAESQDLDRLPVLIDLLNNFQQHSSSWCERLPDYDRYLADMEEARDAYQRAYALVGTQIEQILVSISVTPSDLNEAANLLAGSEAIRALPTWVWPETAGIKDSPDVAQLFCQLVLPQVREKVVSILGSVGELGTYDPDIIRLIPPPPTRQNEDGTLPDLDQHVEAWLVNMLGLLKELPPEIASNLKYSATGNSAESILRQAVGVARKLEGRVSADTRHAIVSSVAAAADEKTALITASLYEEAISFCEQHFGTAADASYAQLKARVEKTPRSTALQDLRTPTLDLRIDHNWMDGRGGKVSLLFAPASDQNMRPYGYVSVPLVVIAKQRKHYFIKLQYEIKTGHREAWPSEWEDPEPTELSIPEEAWRDDPEEPDQYLYTFKTRIPIRRQGRGGRFEFNLTVTNAETGLVYAPFKFAWDLLNDAPSLPLRAIWPETVDLSNVEKHPVGPQKRYRDLLARLQNGGSFSVTAPRRFGKSTLVQFLQSKAREEGFVVPDPVICTSYYAGAQGLDYDKLWQDVSDRLQNELGASMSRTTGIPVPSETAFDHVRRAAAQSGKKGIAILFDEAQLFFSARSAISMGDVLKDKLERHWSQSESGMAKVVFGFIGLPSLQERAGANLNGLLRPIAHNELEEGELNSLILAVTNGALQTTREARRRLARTAGNIYILRTLVDELVNHVQGDGRSWASFDDVVAVEAALRATLRDGRERVVSSYIRDILNDAEDVNLWQPNPAIPLAIAIAESRRKKVPGSKLLEDARSRMTSWFDGLPSSAVTSLAYDSQQFDDHIRILEERSVLRNREFTSCLLEDWLIGLHKTMDEGVWRDLLVSSALKRIRIPAVLKKVSDAEGGEATVRIGVAEGEPSAYRVTKLRTPEDRLRFAETREVLDRLKLNLDDGIVGSSYVFRIREVGLSADDENDAVQVYRWVEGGDLSRRVAELKGPYVAELGAKLSQGLQFIHGLNILHRDISPRNIVISEEGGDPVIIDFGFARRISDTVKTTFDSEFAAPEVRRYGAKWTKAADVYALGATLAKVLDSGDRSRCLTKIMEACTCDAAEMRPDATRLIAMFEEAKTELHVESCKETAWKKAQAACPSYSASPWFRTVVDKLRGNFASVALGCLPQQFDRSREVANLLNQVLEAYSVSQRIPDKLTLGKVKDDNSQTGKIANSEAVKFMHSLRNYHSHGSIRSKTKLTDDQMLQYSLEAAKQIGQVACIDGLENLARLLAAGRD